MGLQRTFFTMIIFDRGVPQKAVTCERSNNVPSFILTGLHGLPVFSFYGVVSLENYTSSFSANFPVSFYLRLDQLLGTVHKSGSCFNYAAFEACLVASSSDFSFLLLPLNPETNMAKFQGWFCKKLRFKMC